jgi:hypothetical protein
MNFSDCQVERKATPHGEETSINVVVDVGTQRVSVMRSTVEADLNFERFVEELDRFLDLAVTEEMESMRAAWAPAVDTDDGSDVRPRRHNSSFTAAAPIATKQGKPHF